MINVGYNKKFIKDLKDLKSTPYYNEIVTFCYETIPNCETIEAILKNSQTTLIFKPKIQKTLSNFHALSHFFAIFVSLLKLI
jgi:hypothetical protein